MQRWATDQNGYWTEQQWVAGDFTGDGKDDLAKPTRNGYEDLANIDVHRSNGKSFNMERWATRQGLFLYGPQKWLVGDFNADGKDDLAKVDMARIIPDPRQPFNDKGVANIDVYLSNGNGFHMQRWATEQGGYWDGQKWFVGDFDGDGKDDMGKAFNDNGLASIDFHISTGKGFIMHRAATRQGGFWPEQQWFVGDFDGDGRDEPGKVFSANGLASMDVYI